MSDVLIILLILYIPANITGNNTVYPSLNQPTTKQEVVYTELNSSTTYTSLDPLNKANPLDQDTYIHVVNNEEVCTHVHVYCSVQYVQHCMYIVCKTVCFCSIWYRPTCMNELSPVENE